MTSKLTRKEIKRIRRKRLQEIKERYKDADCGTPIILDRLKVEKDYRKMLWENGVETEPEKIIREGLDSSFSQPNRTTRKALIVGSTGLIGGYCLQNLLSDPTYSEVTALVRKPLITTHRKLHAIITKFNNNLENDLAKIQADDVYSCLGTTIKKAGSQEAFKQVDYSLVLSIAEIMRRQGAEQFLVISSMGADPNSKVFYSRVKGEMEQALKQQDYPCLRIIRPSLLLGSREEFRLGERIGVLLSPVLKPLMIGSLKKYRPVQAESVAKFMVKVAHEHPISGVHVYESDKIG